LFSLSNSKLYIYVLTNGIVIATKVCNHDNRFEQFSWNSFQTCEGSCLSRCVGGCELRCGGVGWKSNICKKGSVQGGEEKVIQGVVFYSWMRESIPNACVC